MANPDISSQQHYPLTLPLHLLCCFGGCAGVHAPCLLALAPSHLLDDYAGPGLGVAPLAEHVGQRVALSLTAVACAPDGHVPLYRNKASKDTRV